jgi:hypothetical protein
MVGERGSTHKKLAMEMEGDEKSHWFWSDREAILRGKMVRKVGVRGWVRGLVCHE